MPKSIPHEVVSDDHRSKFVVQIGKGPKGSYKTKLTTDKQAQAYLYYNGLNIGYGYKKRILVNGKVIARDFS